MLFEAFFGIVCIIPNSYDLDYTKNLLEVQHSLTFEMVKENDFFNVVVRALKVNPTHRPTPYDWKEDFKGLL